MPRIKKRGLDYFPINTDFIHDRLVRRIMKREGDAALSVLLEVLTYIYAGEGYYVSADTLFYEDLSANLYEKSADDVKRIVALAVEYGIFDSLLFSRHGILTSADIQRQYLFSTKRRSVSQLEADYCLLNSEEQSSLKSKGDGSGSGENAGNEPLTGAKEENPKELRTDENVAIMPENVTSGTHSIAQNSIAQHSVAENSKEYPLPNPPTGGEERRKEENLESVRRRKEWTHEMIDALQPPGDGEVRNYEGLVYNMRLYKIPPTEQYTIIRKSNFGVIGGAVWKGFCVLRDSGGKIKLPGRYLLSVMNK